MNVFCHVFNKDISLPYRSNLVLSFLPGEIEEVKSDEAELVEFQRIINDWKRQE